MTQTSDATFPLPGVEFRPLAIPHAIDDDDAADFIEMVRVRNIVYRQIAGHDDHKMTPEELLPHYRPDDYEIRNIWIVVKDGAVVGRFAADVPLEDGSKVVYWFIELVREVWNLGIGGAAYALIEQTARDHGRTVLQSWSEAPDAEGPRLVAPTGFGHIPETHATRFYQRQGYTLEQIERISTFDLTGSFDRVEALLAEAEDAASGYRIVQWTVPTPPEFVDGYAWMKSRMSTDAPSAGLEADEETWDAARIARHDSLYLDSGRTVQVTAAQHEATGELCAFNELVIGTDKTEASHQEDTLVLKEHRGHRLGALVKCAALISWREVAPDSPKVMTYNAEENRPMLDINEAIGFVPIAYEGAWKKELT